MTNTTLRPLSVPQRNHARETPQQVALSAADLGINLGCADVMEQYRILLTKVTAYSSKSQTILISSASPGDGKSTTAAHLAFTLSLRRDSSVLLLLADDDGWNGPEGPVLGLAEVLNRRCTLDQALGSVDGAPNLSVLQAGTGLAHISDLVAPTEWDLFSMTLRERFEHIVIDSPPYGATSNYYVLQSVADGIVLVVRPEHTSRTDLQDALKAVPPQKLLGVLINAFKNWPFWRANEPYRASVTTQEK
jgi:Mrp family chromosome partitioning ATPase